MYTFKPSAFPPPTHAAEIYTNKPEKILTLPENEQLMPENEPEKNLKIQLPFAVSHLFRNSRSLRSRRLKPLNFFGHSNIFGSQRLKTPRHFNKFQTTPQNLRPFQYFPVEILCMKPNNCQPARFLYHPANASWAHNDDFLAFAVIRERKRLDFDERFEAFLFQRAAAF